MIQLFSTTLPGAAARWLRTWQQEIDDISDYPGQVARAKSSFKARNIKSNKTFQVVRKQLASMCSGARRCAYCEDSVADEVEHMRPKDLYPSEVFSWNNYVYACGPCNSPKGSQYSIVAADGSGRLIDVGRKRQDDITKPPNGTHAILDPRLEDPSIFLELDLRGTFLFVEVPPKGTVEHLRAEYTIKVLHLLFPARELSRSQV